MTDVERELRVWYRLRYARVWHDLVSLHYQVSAGTETAVFLPTLAARYDVQRAALAERGLRGADAIPTAAKLAARYNVMSLDELEREVRHVHAFREASETFSDSSYAFAPIPKITGDTSWLE